MNTNIRRTSFWFDAVLFAKFFLLFASAGMVAQAASVMLVWNPSMSPDVVGYNIYYGASGSGLTNEIATGNVTNLTVAGLSASSTYYFAAKAINSSGVESSFSSEVSYAVPALAAMLQPNFSLSGQFSLTVSGVPGYNYIIQASTNLTQWVSVQTNPAPFTFVDSKSGKFRRRFYRAVYFP